MAITLRPYQESAVRQVLDEIEQRPILVAPTGSGKTVMAVEIIKRHSGRVLFLAHRRELIAQAAERLRAHGIDSGLILAGERPRKSEAIQVASVQTLGRRTHPPAGLVVIDEAHHATSVSYVKILESYPNAHVIGLTATPFRTDGKGLGRIFGTIVVAAYADELVENGSLIRPRFYCAKNLPDLRGVKIVAGDYNLEQLGERMSEAGLVGDMVDHWQRIAGGARTVCYAVNVAHSQAIVQRFRDAGIEAEHLDGTTPNEVRAACLARLRRGDTRFVSNCMVLTEGWDLPALEVCVVARPTASRGLHLQMIGRVMRPHDEKQTCIVLDHAGNFRRFGSPMERLVYSLHDRVKRVVEEEADAEPETTKACEACGLECEKSALVCEGCGTAFPKKETPVESDGELVEVADEPQKPALPPFKTRQNYWNWVERERQERNYKIGYSSHKYHAKYGVWPTVDEDGALVDESASDDVSIAVKESVYRGMLKMAREKGKKPGWAAYLYKDRFGVFPPWSWRESFERERANLRGVAQV